MPPKKKPKKARLPRARKAVAKGRKAAQTIRRHKAVGRRGRTLRGDLKGIFKDAGLR